MLAITDGIIFHQANCTRGTLKGLAANIARNYPWSVEPTRLKALNNLEKYLSDPFTPGTYYHAQKGKLGVVSLSGQYVVGKPYHKNKEDYKKRMTWFETALTSFIDDQKEKNQLKLYFPYQIGCGLAGGDWEKYYALLNKIQEKYPNVKMTILKHV